MNGRGVLPRVRETLPPGWKAARSPRVDQLYSLRVSENDPGKTIRRYHLLYSDSVRVARSLDLYEILRALETDLQLFVASSAPSRLFVHAGVVGWRGKAIVLPGTTFSGKTSLVAAMVRAGATYYSDEYAVLDRRGRVHPYPRPLVVRENERAARGRKILPEDLGGRRGRKPLPLGLVVASRYERGSRWRPRRLSTGEALMALLANTVTARTRPKEAMATLARAVGGVPSFKGTRGEAEDVAASILG